MSERVIDQHGFLREGEHIVVVLPAYNAAIPFRVRSVDNKDTHWINYGPVPYTFTGYSKGVIPGRNATPGFKFSDITGMLTGEQATDMFYHKKEDILIHAYVDIRPHLFRIYREIPTGTKQTRYLRTVTFTTTVGQNTSLFGYTVGVVEQFFFPNFHIDWFVHNATNMDLRTNVMIKYAEYTVEIPRDPEFIFNLMLRKYPAYWYTLPIQTKFTEMDRLFSEIYKMKMIPLYKTYERERALSEIPEMIKEAVI